MIISEQTGILVGFEYNQNGFQFQIDAYSSSMYGVPQSYFFPFNENRPKLFDIDEFQGKRVKITVEMEKED